MNSLNKYFAKLEIFKLILLLILTTQVLSASEIGGYAGTSNRMVLDPLAAGTGGITLFENTSDNAYANNPASQAWKHTRLFYAGMAQLSLDRYIYSVNVGLPLPPTAHLNMGLVSAGTRDIESRDSRGFYAGDLDDSEMTYFLSFSNRFSDKLAFGLAFKLLSKKFSSDDGWLDLKGTGFGAGLGLIFKPIEKATFSLAVKDWNAAYKWKTDAISTPGKDYNNVLPMSLAWGWQQQFDHMSLSFEHDHYFVNEDIFRLATSYTGLNNLILNAGFSLEDETLIPGTSARYDLHLRDGRTLIHIDLGISGGVQHEGLRSYLGWGVNF